MLANRALVLKFKDVNTSPHRLICFHLCLDYYTSTTYNWKKKQDEHKTPNLIQIIMLYLKKKTLYYVETIVSKNMFIATYSRIVKNYVVQTSSSRWIIITLYCISTENAKIFFLGFFSLRFKYKIKHRSGFQNQTENGLAINMRFNKCITCD